MSTDDKKVHRFDGQGRSLHSYEELERQNKILTGQVERLKNALRAQLRKAQPAPSPEIEDKPTRH